MTRRRFGRRRFRTDEGGASAVEFAMVAPLFFALIFSCFEAGWTMVQSTLLDRAIDRTIRLVRLNSGEIERTEEAIRTRICEEALVLSDCQNRLVLEMTVIRAEADFPEDEMACIDRSTDIRPAASFDPGASHQIVFVRACATLDLFTPGLGLGLALDDDGDGQFQLKASSAFLNE